MFTFVKLKDKDIGLNYPYMLEITDIDNLIHYQKTYFKDIITKGLKDLTDVILNNKHHKNFYSTAIHSIYKSNNKSLLNTIIDLENDIIINQVNLLKKYGKIFINHNGGYMLYYKDLVITDKIV